MNAKAYSADELRKILDLLHDPDEDVMLGKCGSTGTDALCESRLRATADLLERLQADVSDEELFAFDDDFTLKDNWSYKECLQAFVNRRREDA